MRTIHGIATLMALAPLPAIAQQQQLDREADSAGLVTRQTPADSVLAMRAIWAAERQMTDQCKKYGCLAIVNMTDNYDAVGLYLDAGPPTGHANPKWSPNQFSHARLEPHKAYVMLKSGNATMCGLPARVELEHQKTREQLTVLGQVDLCRSGQDSQLLIRVLTPEVNAEDGKPAEGKAP